MTSLNLTRALPLKAVSQLQFIGGHPIESSS